eukprot:5489538-Pleurochrysis_carterae.AAC.2
MSCIMRLSQVAKNYSLHSEVTSYAGSLQAASTARVKSSPRLAQSVAGPENAHEHKRGKSAA